MAYFVSYFFAFAEFYHRVHRLHIGKLNLANVLSFRVVALRDVNNVVFGVFFYHKPRSAAQSEAFTLPDGVEPESLVPAKFSASLEFDDVAFPLADVFADIIVVVYLSQEADALGIMTLRARKVVFLRKFPYFAFWQFSNGKHRFF